MDFIAIRSMPDGSPMVSKCRHHFDVACPKCKYTYGLWVRCQCLTTSFEKIGKIGSCSFFPMCVLSTKIRF